MRYQRPRRDPPEPAAIRELFGLIAAFAVASALAGLLGAVNTGTALFFGQLAFAAALVWMLLRQP